MSRQKTSTDTRKHTSFAESVGRSHSNSPVGGEGGGDVVDSGDRPVVRRIIQRIIEFLGLAQCEHCSRRWCGAKRRRQRTEYVDDNLNWSTLCDGCQEYNDEYWGDRWGEYWGGLL